MISKAYVISKHGEVIDQLAKEWGAKATYNVEGEECVSVMLHWTTPNKLNAMIGITYEDEGFEIISFLNRQDVQSSRTKSWDTPASKLRARLNELKSRLDGHYLPPLGRT